MVFQADYNKIELKKLLRYFSDVITITSLKNVTKITTHIFFSIWALQS